MSGPGDDVAWSAGARLYSGRVDPSWSVDASRARAAVAAFRALVPSARVHPEGGGVGYRGWVSIEDGMNGMGEMAESLAFLRRKVESFAEDLADPVVAGTGVLGNHGIGAIIAR